MRRADFCKLIGKSEAQFKNLARRNQLPFPLPDGDDQKRHYATQFTVHGALCIVLLDDLTRRGGLSLKLAAEIIRRNSDSLIRQSLLERDVEKELWIGCVQFLDADQCEDEEASADDLKTIRPLAGTSGEVADMFITYTAGAEAFENASNARVFLANASMAVRTINERADTAGIKLFPDTKGD